MVLEHYQIWCHGSVTLSLCDCGPVPGKTKIIWSGGGAGYFWMKIMWVLIIIHPQGYNMQSLTLIKTSVHKAVTSLIYRVSSLKMFKLYRTRHERVLFWTGRNRDMLRRRTCSKGKVDKWTRTSVLDKIVLCLNFLMKCMYIGLVVIQL